MSYDESYRHHRNIIIGAGISGIYLANKLRELGQSYFILEKNDYIGGRALWKNFHNSIVTMGAGVIRASDINVISLCKKLNIDLKKSESKPILHDILKINSDIFPSMISQIKNTFDKLYQTNLLRLQLMTMDEFLLSEFDHEFNHIFRTSVVYNDFYSASVIDTLKNYPYTDLLPKLSTIYTINGGWKKLLVELVKLLEQSRINLNCMVEKIDSRNKSISTSKNKSYTYDNLFICTDISINNINGYIPTKLKKTLNNIGSIEFIRIYSYHPSGHGIANMIITPGLLHKLIPITDKILMVAYSDGNRAKYLNKLLECQDKESQLKIVNKYYEKTIDGLNIIKSNITDIVFKYWEHGIHYFKPYNQPLYLSDDNINLIGEFISENQGWVEGAIQSVNDFIKNFESNLNEL